jgi:excisionase family DNA binding protein
MTQDSKLEAPASRLLTITQLADELNCSTRTAWRLVGAGLLQVVRLGRAVRVSRDSVNRFIETGGKK